MGVIKKGQEEETVYLLLKCTIKWPPGHEKKCLDKLFSFQKRKSPLKFKKSFLTDKLQVILWIFMLYPHDYARPANKKHGKIIANTKDKCALCVGFYQQHEQF